MKTAFIDWTEDNLSLYLFINKNLEESISVSLENDFKQALASLEIGNVNDIFLSIPAGNLSLRELDLPFSEREKIKETIPFELEGILLGSIDDYAIDHIILDTVDSGSRILAVCLDKEKLREIIDIFSGINLEPKVITSIDLPLYRGESGQFAEKPSIDTEERIDAARKEILKPSINLRQDEYSFTGDIIKINKRLKLTALLTLTFLLIIASTIAVRLTASQNEQRLLTEKIQSIYWTLFPEDKKVIDIERQFTGKMNMLIKKKEALAGIPAMTILQNIAVKNERKIRLYEFNADSKGLIIRGMAGSFEEVESFKNSLASVFINVKVQDSNSTPDNKINFTIIMQEKSV